MPHARRIVHFAGRVQGVGFRATTCRIAQDFAVAGYVQNLNDGRVRVEVEGETGEIDGFLAAVRGRFGRYVQHEEDRAEPTQKEFEGFEIRF